MEMTFSETMSLANALMSPFFWSISTRSSRAGPTAFLAACNNASWTALDRTSRLMPFSRSQNSKTAKKSAFILFLTVVPQGNKKVGRLNSSDFGGLANQLTLPFWGENRGWREKSQAQNPVLELAAQRPYL